MKARYSKAELRRLWRLIEEAVVDAYTPDEQEVAFLSLLQENLACPVQALVIGEEVEVVGFGMDGGESGVMAVCKRKGKRYRVSVTSLAWPGRPPPGLAWIDAYRVWLGAR